MGRRGRAGARASWRTAIHSFPSPPPPTCPGALNPIPAARPAGLCAPHWRHLNSRPCSAGAVNADTRGIPDRLVENVAQVDELLDMVSTIGIRDQDESSPTIYHKGDECRGEP